jgi:phage shock protein E
MKLIIPLLVVALVVVVFTLKAAPGLSAEAARAQLKSGALLVDVRTVEEFSARHLPNAVNIPLGNLKEKLPQLEPDKSRGLLLYCRSGRRSGMAERELRQLGYTNAFNLGSFEQARKVVANE